MVGVSVLEVNVSQEISFDNFTSNTNVTSTSVYRMSPLHEMIWFGDTEGAESFIKENQESGDIGDVLRTYDRDGRSVLMYAIIKRNIKLIKLLIEAKIPVNYNTEEGFSALFYAVFYNLKEGVDALLKHNAEIDVKSKGRSPVTPLQLACAKGHVQIVASLLQAGATVEVIYETQDERFNPLMLTLHSSEISASPIREAICELLLSKKVKASVPRTDGCTALMCAIDKNMTDFVRLILENSTSRLDQLAADKCTTALWVAMQRRSKEIVDLLIAAGVKVDTGKSRSSPLHAATQYNFPHGCKILLDKGVPAVWMDQAGFTPLHYASCLHDTTCLEMLLEKGAINLEIPAKRSGFTPLVVASLKGNIPGMKLLIEQNAKIETFDKKDGLTPLIATMIDNKVDALNFLLENKADVMGRRGGNGMTPLMNAIGLHRDIIRDIISEYSKEHGKRGEMRKQGGGHRSKGWKKRTFVLYGTYFYYYKTDKQISPQGIVILDNAKIEDSPKGPLNFQVVTPARTYQIKADTEEMRKDWFDALTEAVTSYKPEQKPSQAFGIEGKIPDIPDLL